MAKYLLESLASLDPSAFDFSMLGGRDAGFQTIQQTGGETAVREWMTSCSYILEKILEDLSWFSQLFRIWRQIVPLEDLGFSEDVVQFRFSSDYGSN